MERTSIDSSNIRGVGYDAESAVLEIEFLNGSVYQYFDIPLHVYEELMSTGSAGSYLAKNIKGHYRFSRV